jgi:hypothetical protein
LCSLFFGYWIILFSEKCVWSSNKYM